MRQSLLFIASVSSCSGSLYLCKAGSWHTSWAHTKTFHSSPCKAVTICVQNFDAVDVANRRVLLVGPDGPVSKQYDLLVGADGARSTVRSAIVKRDRHMMSQLSFVARMRYVTATGLEAHPAWPDEKSARITSPPLESLFEEPAVTTKGAHTTGTAQLVGSSASVLLDHPKWPLLLVTDCIFMMRSGIPG